MLLQRLSLFDEAKGFSDEVEKSAFYCFHWLVYCVGYVFFILSVVIVYVIYLYDISRVVIVAVPAYSRQFFCSLFKRIVGCQYLSQVGVVDHTIYSIRT